MSDNSESLVARLRQHAGLYHAALETPDNHIGLLLQASNEIERLREALERIANRNFFNDKPPDQAMKNIALAALHHAGFG